MTEEQKRDARAALEARRVALLSGTGSLSAEGMIEYDKLLDEEAELENTTPLAIALCRSPAEILAEMQEKGPSDRLSIAYMDALAEEARLHHGAEIVHVPALDE